MDNGCRNTCAFVNSAEEFTRLWTKAEPLVANFIALFITSFQDAEDVLQDVSVALFRNFGRYDPSRSFVSWALGFAKVEVRRSRRFQARHPLPLFPDILDSLSGECEAMAPELEARGRALQECLQALEGRSQEVIRLRYEQDLKPRFIAGQMNLGSGAIRVLLSRVRSVLRSCVEQKLQAVSDAWPRTTKDQAKETPA